MATIPAFSPPDWLKTETAEQIQARMMESLPPDIDDTEGGFPWDFTYPTALEKDELLNFHLVETLKLMFPAWSYGAYLDGHARADGLSRRPANAAAGIVTFTGTPGTQIPDGTVVCVPSFGGVPAIEYATDSVAYIGEATDGEDGTVDVAVTAVEPGPTGNVGAGAITIMMDPIAGVTLVTNADKITGGAEEEDDESLRLRIAEYDETSGESFVGCDADYIRWAKEVSGVGTVLVDAQYEKTHPNWVRLIILDSSGEPANGSIIQNVYDHIMRDDNRIERKAPVGAILLVQAPEGEVVNISVEDLQLDGTKTAAEVEEIFRTALIEYYITAKADSLVKYNEIHAALTRTEGVKNFSKILVNSDVKDIPLDPADYPCTGEISRHQGYGGDQRMSTRKNFDLEKFPENRVSKRMISRVSPIYERSYVAKWLYEVMGREVDDAEIRFSELREQANPETATWALRYWEQRYGIETNENRSLAARRADIIARRGARAPMNVARLEAMIRAMTGCETSVTDYIAPYTFGVRIIADGSEGIDIRKISEEVKESEAFTLGLSDCDFLQSFPSTVLRRRRALRNGCLLHRPAARKHRAPRRHGSWLCYRCYERSADADDR